MRGQLACYAGAAACTTAKLGSRPWHRIRASTNWRNTAAILPPPYQSDDRLFHEWMLRHGDYFMSLECLQLYRLPSMSPLWNYGQSYFRNEIFRKLAHVTRVAGRRLTPDDMALCLDHASKETVVQSYDCPIAIAMSLFLISMGWRHYAFPFIQQTSAPPARFPQVLAPLCRILVESSLEFLETEPGLTNLNNDILKTLDEASIDQELSRRDWLSITCPELTKALL
ncbi:hypothetical protein GQ53DRAFT_806535 [Thozetella sp. PMI_491]|nr:hypothetical protein GQ53DRAFT_806535 [Thozetella sp. PMI_491]